jgi:hypothetical protein
MKLAYRLSGILIVSTLFFYACRKNDTPQTSSGGSVSPAPSSPPPVTSEPPSPPSTQPPPTPPPTTTTPAPSCGVAHIPVVFQNNADCQSAAQANPQFVLTPGEGGSSPLTVGASASCGTTSNFTLDDRLTQAPAVEPGCNFLIAPPGITINVDSRVAPNGADPSQAIRCSGNPVVVPFGQNGLPTCKPVLTLSNCTDGSLMCTAQCVPI